MTGHLDAVTLPRLAAALRRAAHSGVPLVVDLRAVTALDAAAEAVIERAREAGAQVVVLPPVSALRWAEPERGAPAEEQPAAMAG